MSKTKRCYASAMLFALLYSGMIHAQTATTLAVLDTRNDNTTPASYASSIQSHFKFSSVINAPAGGGSYTTVFGIRGWGDNSGGKAHELAFTDNNQLYMRSGFTPTWENWRKILSEDLDGNVGIGILSTKYKLDVNGPNTRIASNSWAGITFEKQPYPNEGALLFSSDRSGYVFSIGNKRFSDGNVLPIITMYDYGNVGIGTTTPAATLDVNGTVRIGSTSTPGGYRLFVEQGILTEKIKVAVKTSADWADHVFDKNYPLMPVPQLEQYILQHKHLPGIPSAAEVVKEGIDLGKMNAKLLEKIEELTLYTISLQKENKAMQEKLAAMEKRLDSMPPRQP